MCITSIAGCPRHVCPSRHNSYYLRAWICTMPSCMPGGARTHAGDCTLSAHGHGNVATCACLRMRGIGSPLKPVLYTPNGHVAWVSLEDASTRRNGGWQSRLLASCVNALRPEDIASATHVFRMQLVYLSGRLIVISNPASPAITLTIK